MKILVDSDVLIEVLRGRNQDILSRWIALGMGGDAIVYTPIAEAELWAGARPSEHAALSELFQTLLCLPIDCEVGRRAGQYIRQYRKSHDLKLGDALIAAAAFVNDAQLWTRNHKHYPMKELSFY